MQKKIIALAIAGLASSAAFAADTVTLYGVADAYVGAFSATGAQNSNQVNSGGLAASRIGFKGVEDLGGGLKALFVLEYRLDIDGNNAIGGTYNGVTTDSAGNAISAANQSGPARQQMVGLTGNFGTVVAGRLQTAGYDWAVKFDALGGTAVSPLQFVNGNFKIGGTNLHARANNALAYISPSFSGVTLAANYALAAEESALDGATSNKIAVTQLAATYENGPIAAGVVFDKQSTTAVSLTQDPALAKNSTDWAFGASYNFGVAKLFATYQTTKNNDGTVQAADIAATTATFGTPAVAKILAGDKAATNKAYSIGVTVPVSAAGTIVGSYAVNKIATTDVADNNKAYTLAYTHALSKRTTAYAAYTRVNADDFGTSKVVLTSTAGGNSSGLLAGINHKF